MTIKDNRRETFIRKATEARERAAQTDDPWLRQMLKEIAAGYEVLAEKEPEEESDENGDTADV